MTGHDPHRREWSVAPQGPYGLAGEPSRIDVELDSPTTCGPSKLENQNELRVTTATIGIVSAPSQDPPGTTGAGDWVGAGDVAPGVWEALWGGVALPSSPQRWLEEDRCEAAAAHRRELIVRAASTERPAARITALVMINRFVRPTMSSPASRAIAARWRARSDGSRRTRAASLIAT